jgi:hypothetical protein
MKETDKKVLRVAAIVWVILGLVLMATGNPPGGFFFVLALVYWTRSTEQGESWAGDHPGLARWAIAALTALILLLATIVAVLYLVGR